MDNRQGGANGREGRRIDKKSLRLELKESTFLVIAGITC